MLVLRLASCFLSSKKYFLDMLKVVNIGMTAYTNCEGKIILFRWVAKKKPIKKSFAR